MRLPTFISSNLDAILADWVSFARALQPTSGDLDESGLLDHGKALLQAIASDMQEPQNAKQRQDKSEGNSSTASESPQVPSRSHARQRKRQGFNIEEMVSEYRALRATVLRQWAKVASDTRAQDLEDITRFNEAVDQAIAESLQAFVAELDKSRDLFLGVLGHDLRGPLSTIANIASMGIHARTPESQRSAIVMRSVIQMKALLDDLVEYAKHRLSSNFAIDPQAVDLGEFAHLAVGEISALRDDRAIELKVNGDLQGVWDGRRLHQALSNLIFNALKYGFPGEAIIVTFDGSSEAQVTISVENRGPPIPVEILPTLFDPFVRGEAQAAHTHEAWGHGANMGLGLYVVREIAKAHGGSIEVISNDTLTRFLMTLPRAQTPASPHDDLASKLHPVRRWGASA